MLKQNEYQLIATNKPIMTIQIKSQESQDSYHIEYIIFDKMLEISSRKYIHPKIQLSGNASKENLLELLENNMPVYDFMASLSQKEKRIWLNNQLKSTHKIQTFEDEKKRLPNSSIYLNQMPSGIDNPTEDLLFLLKNA